MEIFREKRLTRRRIFLGVIVVLLAVTISIGVTNARGICHGTSATYQVTNIRFSELNSVLQSDTVPKFSYSPFGKQMAPMSFAFIGSQSKLEEKFQQAQWEGSDSWSLSTTTRLVRAALTDQAYSTAPVTPSCYGGFSQARSFQKPTSKNSVRERHHIRIWATPFTVDGTPLWVGTASFDVDSYLLFAHHIDPAIDHERDFVLDELRVEEARHAQKIFFVPPHRGSNQGGDAYETDGEIAIIYF